VGDTVGDDEDGFAVGDFVMGASLLLELDAIISTGTSLLLNNRVGVVTST
jgi:hypothetical protein